MGLTFRPFHFIVFLMVFVTEICIALFLKEGFIRHTFGDFLVTILMYCFLRSIIEIRPIYLAIFVLVFSNTVEILQYYNVLKLLNLMNNKLAVIVLGNTFQTEDLIAYTIGVIIVFLIDKNFELR